MITACAKALLSTQCTLASVHQVAKELPAGGGLVTVQALGLGHTEKKGKLYAFWQL